MYVLGALIALVLVVIGMALISVTGTPGALVGYAAVALGACGLVHIGTVADAALPPRGHLTVLPDLQEGPPWTDGGIHVVRGPRLVRPDERPLFAGFDEEE